MSLTLEQAPPDVHELAGRIIAEHHPELCWGNENRVRLCILMASDPDDEVAVRCHGYPAAAKISIIPYKQRVDKRADCEIIIDGGKWEESSERQRMALLDHEITHIEVCRDENGFVKTDDLGRPKLKLRLHDFDFGGFRSICQRYGADALEGICARRFAESYGDVALEREKELFAV